MNPYAPLPEKPYLRTAEVANAFGVTPSSVFTWVKNGRLKPIRTPGGNFRFARADVEKLRFGDQPREPRIPEGIDRRKEPRFKVHYAATIHISNDGNVSSFEATIQDISASGLGLLVHAPGDVSTIFSALRLDDVQIHNLPRSPLREVVPVQVKFARRINETEVVVGALIR